MTITDDMVERAAKAMMEAFFAPHELPLHDRLFVQYQQTARAALTAALEGSVAVPAEAFDDLHFHYAAWRVAICRLAVTSCGDDETYWEHELKAFERTFAALPRQER